MRQPHPWYSETRSGGGWFVKLSNEQHFLGKQPEGAAKPVKRNGRWNPASEILAEYHKLMAVRDTASKSDYTLDNIIALYVEELEQENPALAKRYKQILEKLSAFVYKGKRVGKLLVNADLESIHLESWAKKYKSDQTKRTYITFCKSVMEWAVKKKNLNVHKNPFAEAKVPKVLEERLLLRLLASDVVHWRSARRVGKSGISPFQRRSLATRSDRTQDRASHRQRPDHRCSGGASRNRGSLEQAVSRRANLPKLTGQAVENLDHARPL